MMEWEGPLDIANSKEKNKRANGRKGLEGIIEERIRDHQWRTNKCYCGA